jgi:hypothetical protein
MENVVIENDRELEPVHKEILEEMGWNDTNTDYFVAMYATANRPKLEEIFTKIVSGEYKRMSIWSVFVQESKSMLYTILRWSKHENVTGFTLYSCAGEMLINALNKLPDEHVLSAIKFVSNNTILENCHSDGFKQIRFDVKSCKFVF